MSIHWRGPAAGYGWLLYAGPVLGGGVLVGDTLATEISVRNSRWSGGVSITAELAEPAVLRFADQDRSLWEALQTWPSDSAGRRWPPEMKALLDLAASHPEEYARLRDGEAVLRALGG